MKFILTCAAAALLVSGGCGDDNGADGNDAGTNPGLDSGVDAGADLDSGTGPGDGGGADSSVNPGEVLAFPGAEGFGARATGGRGGRVVKVVNLDASGPGSLQAALDLDEPRIIVFEVSGVIHADIIEIPYGDVTIAGQTAPGGGITLHARLYTAYSYDVSNIIIRHLRIRPEYAGSGGDQFDSIQFSRTSNFILDHISVAFGVDETVDLYEAQDVTIQWSSIESSATSGHSEGMHNYGLINGPGGQHVSVHHTLFAHHQNRCPAIANGPASVRNNVMYNVRHGFVHHNPASGPFNIVGNYFRDGADDDLHPFYFDDENATHDPGLLYFLADNYIDFPGNDCEGSIDNPWTECAQDLYLDDTHRAASEFDFTTASAGFVPITTTSSTVAYQAVLDGAGAFPRDVVTQAAVADCLDRTGSWGANIPSDFMQGLTPAAPPVDGDDDGIPDAWETSHSLDPADPSDNHTIMPSGYPAIEEYVNELATALAS